MKKVLIWSTVSSALLILALIIYNSVPEKFVLNADNQAVFESDILSVHKIGTIDRLTAVYVKDTEIYAFEDRTLYKSSNHGMTFEKLGELPKITENLKDKLVNFIARQKITRQIRRHRGPSIITVLDSGTIVVLYDNIYRSTDGGLTFDVIPLPRNISIPIINGMAVTDDDEIYFGEYKNPHATHEVNIVKGSNDGQDWEVVYTFQSGEIGHIHSIHKSKLRDSLIVTTGDDPSSFSMYETKDEFGSLQPIGTRDQGWRTVLIGETDDFMFWGSDNDITGGEIYKFQNNQRSAVQFMGNVSFDTTILKDNTLAVSEAFVLQNKYIQQSDDTNHLSVWLSKDGNDWIKAISYELENKQEIIDDVSYGRIILPTGDGSAKYLLLSSHRLENKNRCQDPCISLYQVDWK